MLFSMLLESVGATLLARLRGGGARRTEHVRRRKGISKEWNVRNVNSPSNACSRPQPSYGTSCTWEEVAAAKGEIAAVRHVQRRQFLLRPVLVREVALNFRALDQALGELLHRRGVRPRSWAAPLLHGSTTTVLRQYYYSTTTVLQQYYHSSFVCVTTMPSIKSRATATKYWLRDRTTYGSTSIPASHKSKISKKTVCHT